MYPEEILCLHILWSVLYLFKKNDIGEVGSA